uniref:Rop5 n=1 Tax=Arundo donax TaxID=35708 RepID=A0A0A9EVL0_ARUDO
MLSQRISKNDQVLTPMIPRTCTCFRTSKVANTVPKISKNAKRKSTKSHLKAEVTNPESSRKIPRKPESLQGIGREQRDKKVGAHWHYSGEFVAGVTDEHAGLAHGAVSHRDALDEPGGAGRHGRTER